MKRPAALPGEDHSNPIRAAYGHFFRSHRKAVFPQESETQWQALEQRAQGQLQAALEQENGNRLNATSLYRLAVKITLATLRQAKQQQADRPMVWVDLSDAPLPDAVLANQQPLQAAVARLPEPRRRAVGLHFSGLTITEISDLLAWGEAKTQQQVERGLDDLRKALRKVGIDYEVD